MGDVGKVWGVDFGVGVYCYRGRNLDSAAHVGRAERVSGNQDIFVEYGERTVRL